MCESIKRASKNVIIVLLFASLVVLTLVTWFGDIQPGNAQRRQIVSELFGGFFWSNDDVDDVYPGYEAYNYTMEILSPVRAAVRGDEGLTYLTNRDDARELFERLGTAFSGAMSTAESRQELTTVQWRNVLSGNMVLLDFEGEMPLGVLTAVVGSSDYKVEERQARYVVFAIARDTLTLVIKAEGEPAVSYRTQVPSTELAALIREYGEGNAQFAFEDDTFARRLPDEFIVQSSRAKPAVIKKNAVFTDYTSTSSERVVNAVLEGFGYNPYTTGGYIEPDGTRVYVEGLSTLRISSEGALSYYAPEPEDVVRSAPDMTTRSTIINQATAMLDRVATDYVGEVSLYIIRASYDVESGRYIVLFGCAADGIVLSFSDGYFARFEYVGTNLVSAHLTIANYILTAQYDTPMPDAQAAATLEEKSTLFELRYVENQNDEYHAVWYYLT